MPVVEDKKDLQILEAKYALEQYKKRAAGMEGGDQLLKMMVCAPPAPPLELLARPRWNSS